MKKSKRCEVAAALSRHCGVGETKLFRGLKLERDLGILPLNLVWFVVEFEDAEGFGFPFERLDGVTTVGELIDLVSSWLADARRFSERDFRHERAVRGASQQIATVGTCFSNTQHLSSSERKVSIA